MWSLMGHMKELKEDVAYYKRRSKSQLQLKKLTLG
jgi:hypothetical protein